MSASAFPFQVVGTKATNLKTAPGRLTADENSGNALSDENAVRDPKVSLHQYAEEDLGAAELTQCIGCGCHPADEVILLGECSSMPQGDDDLIVSAAGFSIRSSILAIVRFL